MSTLGQIIARVESELMYAPDLREHRLDIRQVANARYGLLGRDKPWPWLQRRAPLWVFPDISIATTSVSRPGAPYGNRTMVVAEAALSTLTDAGDWPQHIRPMLAGAEFGPDPTLVTPGGVSNWEDGPFVVELAESHLSGSSRLWLDPRANITNDLDSGTFLLRWPRYLLPADLETLERITDDQGLPLPALSPSLERGYMINAATDGGVRPGWVLEDYGHAARYPAVVYPGMSDSASPNGDQTEDIRSTANLPIRIAPTLTEVAGGSLVTGTRLRVALCWWYANRFGPLSPDTELTTTGTGAMQVSGWSDKVIAVDSSATSGAYGRRLAIFVAESDGAFYLRGWVNPATTSSFTVSHSIDHASTTALPTPTLRMDGTPALPRYDRLYPGGPYTYVRLSPRPTAVARYELDYQARPADLLEDTDALELPDQYSEVLVWATCLGMAERYARGADVSVWKRNHDEWRARLDQRYMPQLRYKMTKGTHGASEPVAGLRRESIRYLG